MTTQHIMQESVHRKTEPRIFRKKEKKAFKNIEWPEYLNCFSAGLIFWMFMHFHFLSIIIHELYEHHTYQRILCICACTYNNWFYFTLIPKLKCDLNQIITYFINQYMFFNSGLYHTYIIIVYTMGSHIVRTLKVLDLYKLAWRWLQCGRNM